MSTNATRKPRISSNPDLLTLDQLAEKLGRAPQTIKNDRRRAPHRVPPAFRVSYGGRLLWRVVDVEAWMAAIVKETTEEIVMPSRPRGRPTKAAALARKRGNLGVNHG